MPKERLKVGDEVRIFENGEQVDRGLIENLQEDGHEIIVKSLYLAPGIEKTFAYLSAPGIKGGWRMLFEGKAGERCFSTRASIYVFEPVP